MYRNLASSCIINESISLSTHGLRRRLARLFRRGTGKLVIAPVDDSLLAGPIDGLESIESKLSQFADASAFPTPLPKWDFAPDAVVGYRLASAHLSKYQPIAPFILNLTASTTIGAHVDKAIVGGVSEALALDAAAVAVHVNFTSRYEMRQLEKFADISSNATASGLPLMGILYPRREKDGRDDNYDALRLEDTNEWTRLVCHATRVGVELGCSIIKTQYTGSARTFERVVRAGEGAAVVIAGGRPRDPLDFIETIDAALSAGAAGVSFGRNFFSRRDSRPWIRAAIALVHEGQDAKEALRWLESHTSGE
jgi:DhnA family fructose-bisphosphate aldolase class Ia